MDYQTTHMDQPLNHLPSTYRSANFDVNSRFNAATTVETSPPPVDSHLSCAFDSRASYIAFIVFSAAATSTSYLDIDAPLEDFAAVPLNAIISLNSWIIYMGRVGFEPTT